MGCFEFFIEFARISLSYTNGYLSETRLEEDTKHNYLKNDSF